jgi:hypothetical protein
MSTFIDSENIVAILSKILQSIEAEWDLAAPIRE